MIVVLEIAFEREMQNPFSVFCEVALKFDLNSRFGLKWPLMDNSTIA